MRRMNIKDRVLAVILAFILAMSGVIPVPADTAKAAEVVNVRFELENKAGEFSVEVFDTADSENALLSKATLGNENFVEVALDTDTTYNYVINKTGYQEYKDSIEVADKSFTHEVPVATEEEPEGMKLEVIELSKDDISLVAGESETVMIKNEVAEGGYTWESENKKIAKVEDGKITAVGYDDNDNETTITVTGPDKTTKASVNVKVSKANSSVDITATPNGKKDATKVTCVASVTPSDATGTVKFYANGTLFATKELSGGKATAVYEETAKNEILGGIEFKAVYSGNNKYDDSEKSTNGTYKKSTPLKFKDDKDKTVVREDVEDKTFVIEVEDTKVENRTLKFTSNNEEVATVDEKTGKVEIVAPGKAEIKVTADAEGNYVESEAIYTVVVKNVITAEEIDWKPVSKVYDGTTDIEITGSLKEEDVATVKGAASVTVTYKAAIEDANVGTEKNVTLGEFVKVEDNKLEDVKGFFVFDIDGDKVDGKVDITRKTVYLATNDYEVTYGESTIKQVEAADNLVKVSSGVVDRDEINLENAYATVEKDVYDIKAEGYKGEIKPVVDTQELLDDNANYTFAVAKKEKLGTLTVVAGEANLEKFNVIFAADGGKLLEKEDKVQELWISGGKLKASITENSFYDQVMFVDAKGNTVDLVAAGYDVSTINTSSISGKLYLAKAGANAKSNSIDYVVNVDKDAPTIKFTEWEEKPAVIENLGGAITFNKFTKSVYSVNMEATDDVSNQISTLEGAGINEWSYYSYKVDEDNTTYKDISDTIKSLDADAWTKGNEDGTIVYAKDDTNLTGEYIVLVKIEDKLGNPAVYASNGIVVEIEQPVITISLKDGSPIDTQKPYGSDVDYKVTVTDMNSGTDAVTSALSEVKIKLVDTKTGKVFYDEKVEYLIDKKTGKVFYDEKGEYLLNVDGKSYTIKKSQENAVASLQENAVASIDEDYTVVESKLNSNNLAIVVTAIDKAGNTTKTSQSLMVEDVPPVINVKYDSEAEVQNDKYFNKARTMTIEYVEKNFDVNGLSFDLSVDGVNTEKAITYEELKGKAETYGIEVGEITDSQSDKDKTSYTDERTNTLKITFNGLEVEGGREAAYTIVPSIKDAAGIANEGINYADTESECNDTFVVDQVAPVINVTYSEDAIANALEEKDREYTQEVVTANVTITETNFQKEKPVKDQFNMDATTPEKDNYEETAYEKWAVGNVAYEKAFVFNRDANYTFGFTYTDLAGNSATYDTHYFTVDDTDPTGTIKLDNVDGLSQQIQNVFSFIFNWFKKDSFEISLTAEDITAGIKSVSYFTTPKVIKESKTLEELDWKEYKDPIEKKPDEQFFVYGRVIDKAGNTIYLSTTDGAVAEDNKPEVTIVETSKPVNGKGIYDRAIPLKITATDVDGNNVEDSGIEKIWYKITADVNGKAVNKEGVLYDKKSSLIGKDIKIGQGKATVTCDLTVPTKFNSNNIKVTVHVRDVSGNESKNHIDLKMDTVNPKVNIDPALVKGYYNKTVGTTIKVTERNFDKSNAHLTITNTDKKAAYTGAWQINDAGKYDSALNTCKVEFREDGDYVMNFYCIDKAGRKSNEYKSPVVTIDKTEPVIKVSYDNNDAENGNYYDAPRTATVTITEHNFDAKDVKFDTNGSVSGWRSAGDVHTATVRFSSDEDYHFDIDYTDLAGNKAADYARDEFTVDLTNPTVEIKGVGDRSANKGKVAPEIVINDTNFKANGVEITLTGANKGKVDISSMASTSTSANGRVIRFNNFAEGMDDVYTLTATSVDMAGNETTKTILFSVNRDGSTYKVNDYTKELIEKGYTNDPQDIVIVETNVDTLTFVELSYTKDGKIVVLEKDKDYKIGVTGGETSWKQYTYTIYASAFEEEGKYNINISSVDRAKNESNNKVQSMTVEFVVDKTVPTLAISNLEDRGRYDTNTHQFIVNVKDNTALSKVEIYMENKDGELVLVETREGDDLVVENGKLYVDVKGKDGFQNVKVIVYDEAGNTVESEEYSILVTENKLLLFYANKPLFFGSIIGLLAVIGGIIFFILKKKKDEEEKAK